mmetsp:Transcript_25365/g.63610  ORF Transcript_25365/g.63610 Transcript_25365/m.63610 type:complete len:138 (-) Transcript_25365:148-561(-)
MPISVCHMNNVSDSVYDPSGTYVLFPSSASFFGVRSVGHILLENRSQDYPLLLTSQRRGSAQPHAHTLLPPQQRHAFDYSGEWMIQEQVPPHLSQLLLRTLTDLRELLRVLRLLHHRAEWRRRRPARHVFLDPMSLL